MKHLLITLGFSLLTCLNCALAQSYQDPGMDILTYLNAQQQQLSQQLTYNRNQLIQWYLAQVGYEQANYEYQMALQTSANYGYTPSFEDFIFYQAMQAQGVDMQALAQQQKQSNDSIAAARQDLYAVQDAAHQSWYQTQILDNRYADFNLGAIRGEWDYQNAITGEVYRLPYYPDANTAYASPYSGDFTYNDLGWYQTDPTGYSTPLMPLPQTMGW